MILRSSYTQSVFSVYSIYTEDIIERYLIKSVNISDGRTRRVGKAERAGKNGRNERAGKAERIEKAEKTGKTGKTGKAGKAGKAGRVDKAGTGGIGWDRRNGCVLIKILPIEENLLPLLKVKNILYRKNEYKATTSIK